MSSDSPGIYDDTYVSRNDFGRRRRVAKRKAASLGHQMRYFILYYAADNGPAKSFASDCRICGAMLIDDWTTYRITGSALTVACHR
jgi:hypothetical protein